jgi:hypothetical protein
MKVGMGLLREWNQLSADLEAQRPTLPRLSDGDHLAKVGRVCVRHPQEFAAMLVEALAVEPGVAAVLRAALDAHDAEPQPQPESVAAPVPRVDGVPRPAFDDPDEVLL